MWHCQLFDRMLASAFIDHFIGVGFCYIFFCESADGHQICNGFRRECSWQEMIDPNRTRQHVGGRIPAHLKICALEGIAKFIERQALWKTYHPNHLEQNEDGCFLLRPDLCAAINPASLRRRIVTSLNVIIQAGWIASNRKLNCVWVSVPVVSIPGRLIPSISNFHWAKTPSAEVHILRPILQYDRAGGSDWIRS